MKLPFALGVCLLLAAELSAQNFTSGTATAKKFGVHEIVLAGNGGVANPFDTPCRVTFTAPSGAAKTVDGFFDGGSTWRARVYVSETGTWRWSSSSTDPGLDGKSGSFAATSSALRGRLLVHPRNPRQWATENGRWFLNLNDTAYHLFSPRDREGKALSETDFQTYVRDCVAKGITSVRSWSVFASDGTGGFASSNSVWKKAYFADTAYTKLQVGNFARTDARLRWMLDNHPDVYVQLILLPSNDYGKDDSFWRYLSTAQRQRVLKHLVARYAAFPQMFWLVVNDTHYGTSFPYNDALAREVGKWFQTNDPWKHPMATGPNRDRAYPFPSEAWSTYIHIEDQHDLGAAEYAKYHAYAKPVFLGEDRYEQDHGTSRDPVHMRYWQRRLFWAWLLSGGSTNYGGRWWVLHPYSQTGSRTCTSRFNGTVFTKQLVGLDSVPPIRNYFGSRNIELADFQADHALVQDLDGRTGAKAPKLMRRGTAEYLIYHPNAASDGQSADVDGARKARMRVNLSSAAGTFQVQWMRALDGATSSGTAVAGGGARDFTAPWTGADVVLWLKATTSTNAAPSVAITSPASAATYTPPATVAIAATASDPDGAVVKVEFFSGTSLLGVDTTAPYGFAWSGVPAGTYSLTAKATDDKGATKTSPAVSITVAAPSGTAPALSGLTLIDADADASLGALVDGATINLGALPTRNLSVRADPANAAVESVRFEYDGDPDYRIESQAPFAIAGDDPAGDYNPWTPAVGTHSLRATPYAADSAGGAAGSPVTVRFTVVDDGEAPPTSDALPGSSGDDDGSGGGNCGLLGAELLLLALVRGHRRG